MTIAHPDTFNALICEALGLDASRLAKLVLTLAPQMAPVVEIEQFVTNEEGEELRKLLTRCDLVPRP